MSGFSPEFQEFMDQLFKKRLKIAIKTAMASSSETDAELPSVATDAELPSVATNLIGRQVNLKKRKIVLTDNQGEIVYDSSRVVLMDNQGEVSKKHRIGY
jgi:hypothetical protein